MEEHPDQSGLLKKSLGAGPDACYKTNGKKHGCGKVTITGSPSLGLMDWPTNLVANKTSKI